MVDVRLPSHLDERCVRHPGPSAETPQYVLHWMRAALRLDENPTLMSLALAERLGLPVVITKASTSAILTRPTATTASCSRGPQMSRIVPNSSVSSTCCTSQGTATASAVAKVRPVVEVDAHCVLPRPVFGRTADRPFRFRDATKREMKRRMGQPRRQAESGLARHLVTALHAGGCRGCFAQGWSRVLAGRLPHRPDRGPGLRHDRGLCRDGPVAAYLNEGLSRYHRTRNNAANRGGVSGMSPWLHHGMVAATRLVRDAAEHGTKGAETSSTRCWSSGNTPTTTPMTWTAHMHGTGSRLGPRLMAKHGFGPSCPLSHGLGASPGGDVLWCGPTRDGASRRDAQQRPHDRGKGTVQWMEEPGPRCG